MNTVNNIIKPALLDLFNNGKNEIEAHEEISKTHSAHSVSLNTVNKWFEIFRSGDANLGDKKKTGRKLKFTDEYLINLINENPGLNMRMLAKLANTSEPTISNRLRQINSDRSNEDKIVLQKKKSNPRKMPKKFTDEFLINLINENPELSMRELAKLTDTSISNISNRLKKINIHGERVNYSKKFPKKCVTKFTDESLINLINENPGLNTYELAKLIDTSQSTISNRLRQINNDRPNGDKIDLQKNAPKTRKKPIKITEQLLIELINDNPGLNMTGLSKLANTSVSNISNTLKKINGVNYDKKYTRKFTDEFLINLINENPEMNTYELAKLANTSQSTIMNRLYQINRDEEKVKYNKKGKKVYTKKFTDKFLINLVNDNPGLNIKELADLANTSQTTISNRLKKIERGGEMINYTKKNTQNASKFTDEFLINLINENPSLNMAKLAKLINSSVSTIHRRIKQINANGERAKYIYKNSIAKYPNQ